MTSYFGIWKVNTSIPPQDPKIEVQMYVGFQAMIKQDLQEGVIKEVYSFLEGGSGYFVTGDVTEEKLHTTLLRYEPYVTFELHKVLPLTRSIEELIGVLRARASAMTLTVPA
jgi:hypothetical protein